MQVQKISILPPQKGLEFPGGWEGSVRQNNLKKCMKLKNGISRNVGGLRKNPSMREIWIFSGTSYTLKRKYVKIDDHTVE